MWCFNNVSHELNTILIFNQTITTISRKSNHHKRVLNDNINKQKKFWSQIKNVFPRKSQSMANVSTDKRSSLNILSRFYSTMASKLKKSTYLLTDFTWRYTAKSPAKTTKTFKFPNILVLFVEKELKLLPRQKTTGIDNLPHGILKDCGSIILKPLCDIINLSIRSGKFPSSWNVAKVTPISKSGSRSLPENYRTILVLPIASKVIEKAGQQTLKDHFEEKNLLSKSQHRFIKKHSTKTVSIYFCDSVLKQMNNGKLTGAVYVDLPKAFYGIGDSVLLQKIVSL